MLRSRGMSAMAALAATAVLAVTLAFGFSLSSPSTAAAAPGDLQLVEIRPDRSLLLEWESSNAAAYEVGLSADGGEMLGIALAPGQSGVSTIRFILSPQDWPAEPGVSYAVSVRDFGDGTWPSPAPFALSADGPLELTQTGITPSSVQVSWGALPAGMPFERYDIFVGEEDDPIDSCFSTSITTAATTSSSHTSMGACNPAALQAGTDYTVGVRIVQNANPLVVTSLEATSVNTSGGSQPTERFSTAQVNGKWSVVDQQGDVVQWNGVNVRRNNGGLYITSVGEPDSMASVGFDTIRIVMLWDRFEPEAGVFDDFSFSALDQLITSAQAADLNIILDPLHITDSTNWNVPTWAWQASNNGTPSGNKLIEVVSENVHEYLTYLAQRYRDNENVVGIDLMNEPREPSNNPDFSSNELLMKTYHDMIETVRDIDLDKPLMIEPFFGSARIDTATLASVRNATVANPIPAFTDTTNLIWSMHDYYVGNEGSANDDGLTPSGYALRGADAEGTPVRTERWDGGGCYPSGTSASTCTWTKSRSNRLALSMRTHVQQHSVVAEAAGMPMFVGEYGIPHSSPAKDGWGGGPAYFTDKTTMYDQLGVSRAVWAWSTELDQTFGMYTRATGQLHPWATYAAGETKLATAGSGDVDCDNIRSAADALALLRLATDLVEGGGTCDQPLGGTIADVNGDLDTDQQSTTRDALIIAQCIVNPNGEHC